MGRNRTMINPAYSFHGGGVSNKIGQELVEKHDY